MANARAFVSPLALFNTKQLGTCLSSRSPSQPLTPNLTHPTTLSLPSPPTEKTTSLPSCIPSNASEISDPTAQKMLSSLQYIPIPTRLSPNPIHTSFVCSGTGRTTIIFIHGFDSSLLEYRRLWDQFHSSQATCYFLDILGWGFTERPEDVGYGVEAKREHLRAFIEYMQIQRNDVGGPLILVGASLGAAIAVDYCLNCGSVHVDKLLILDGQIFLDRPTGLTIPGLPYLGSLILRSDWLRWLAIQMAYESDQFKCKEVLLIGSLHLSCPRWLQSTIDFVRRPGYCLSESIANVKVDTHILWGENDRVLPKGSESNFVRLPQSTLTYVKQCGHLPHIEKPSIVSDYIHSLLHPCT